MKRLFAFALAAIWGGGILAADEYTPSININFYAAKTVDSSKNTKGGELTTTDAVGLTGYAVPGTSWDNYTLSSSSATFSTVHQTDASGTASEISGASVMVSNAKSNGVWYRDGTTGDFDGTSDVRNGYIDSQGTMSVTISGIPFDYYKIVMYFAPRTDKSFAIGYTTINDELP